MADRALSHVCRNGTEFRCATPDLREPVVVSVPDGVGTERLCADFAEFGAWHAIAVHPHLKAFSGYDAVRYVAEQL